MLRVNLPERGVLFSVSSRPAEDFGKSSPFSCPGVSNSGRYKEEKRDAKSPSCKEKESNNEKLETKRSRKTVVHQAGVSRVSLPSGGRRCDFFYQLRRRQRRGRVCRALSGWESAHWH